jgi:D-alanyl-D-alanine carboxypeptidase (penicillin-binding protein 5/6)
MFKLKKWSIACILGCAQAATWVGAQVLSPPEVDARAYLLIDVSAHQVLAEHLSEEQVEPASLTKLMSAYLVFDALKSQKIRLDQTMSVSVRAWKMPGSRMFIDPKMQVPVEDLVKGMIVQSGNDATVALAEAVGGTVEHFVDLMNEQARRLGMKSTVYKNPEGLPAPGHLTTAHDLSILAQRLIQDFPQYVGYYAIKKYRYPGTPAANDTNRNTLLFRDPTVDGLKTGHTDAAGYCMIATAKRDTPTLAGHRLLAVVLGASSENIRSVEAQKILNWGFSAFEPIKLFNADQAVSQLRLWKGQDNEVGVGRHEAIVVSVPLGQAKQISTQIEFKDPLVAPIALNATVAQMHLKLGANELSVLPLLALKEVSQASIFGRAWDAIRLWVK